MFKIGDFSKLTRVSVRMLRYYDELGLFKPVKVDNFTSYRYYSAKQIKKLSLIISLRDMGFNVSDIAKIINEPSEQKQKEMLVKKQVETTKNIEKEQHILSKISSIIENIGKDKLNMKYNVKLKEIPAYNVISYRDVIPTYDSEGMLWGKLGEYVGINKIKCGDACFAVYHDDECKDNNIDVEVMMEVKKLGISEGKFVYKKTKNIPQCATLLVPGDYSNIGPAFAFIAKWIEDNEYSICGNAMQFSIRGPWNESNSENYLVEIAFPVYK